MKAYALTLCLKPDAGLIGKYKQYHLAVWPEVLAGSREVGIREMRIFLLGTRMFMYVEAEDSFDPVRDFPRISESPRGQEWDKLMRALQERAPEARPGEWWARMELVFDLNWPQHLPGAQGGAT